MYEEISVKNVTFKRPGTSLVTVASFFGKGLWSLLKWLSEKTLCF